MTEVVENLDLIALGTKSGSLLLYSLTKGDLHTQLVRFKNVSLSFS